MAGWQTMDEDQSMPEYVREFAQIWTNKRKIVFSRQSDQTANWLHETWRGLQRS